MMRNTEYAVRDSGALGLLAVLTHGILKGGPRAPESNATPKTASRGWLDRFDAWLWRNELRLRDEYLAQSTDVFDLELRQRAQERGS